MRAIGAGQKSPAHPAPARSRVDGGPLALFGALGGVLAPALHRDASPLALGAIMSASALAAAPCTPSG